MGIISIANILLLNHIIMKKFIFSLLGVLVLPTFAFALGQTSNTINSTFFNSFIAFIKRMIGVIPPILVGIAGLVFMFEILRFIFAGKDGDAKEKDTIRKHLMWSLVALAVLISFWGIVGTLIKVFGLQTGEKVMDTDIPGVQLL